MLTREQVRVLREKLQTTLGPIGEELGFKLTLGSASFADTVTFKLECAPVGDNGKASSQAEADFKRYASTYGLKADDLGKSFRSNGWNFVLTGLDPRKPKYPLQARRSDGKSFKFTADTVKRCLGLVPVPSVEVS